MYKLTAYIEKGVKGKEAERKYVQHFDDQQEAEREMNKRLILKLEGGFEEVRPEFYGLCLEYAQLYSHRAFSLSYQQRAVLWLFH